MNQKYYNQSVPKLKLSYMSWFESPWNNIVDEETETLREKIWETLLTIDWFPEIRKTVRETLNSYQTEILKKNAKAGTMAAEAAKTRLRQNS